jgi:Rrf2 family iron-sulfur cluster assembly transcriptional regulator
MFAGLRRHGLVKSHRGPGGGYILAKPSTEISVAAIVRAAEDTPAALRAGQNNRRIRGADDHSEKLWESVGGHVYSLLERVSLDDVVADRFDVYQKVFRTDP